MSTPANSLCLCLPDFPLQALSLGPSPPETSACIGLLDAKELPESPSAHRQLHLLCFNQAAAKFQLFRGMRAAHALGRCPNLQLFPRDPSLEAEAQSQLLELANTLSPDFENTAPGQICIDLSGSRAYQQKGQAYLLEHCPADSLFPLQLKFGLAPTPELAQLAAHLADAQSSHQNASPLVCLLSPSDLHSLPITHLGPFIPPAERRELFQILDLWGIRQIGDFLQLCPQETTLRLGTTAHQLHQTLNSLHPRPLRLHRPCPELHLNYDLEHPVESLTPLLFVFQRLIKILSNRLQQLGRVASAIDLTLGYPHQQRYRRKLRVAKPTTDPERLRELIASHFQNFQARAPIHQLRLELIPAHATHQQSDAFEPSLRDPNQFSETLARIESIVGSQSIGRPIASNSHRPDHFQLSPWQCFLDAPAHPTPSAGIKPPNSTPKLASLPLHRFRPPRPIQVECHPGTHPSRPKHLLSGPHTGPVIQSSAPRATSGHWWEKDKHWRQIEWDIQVPNAPLLQLTHNPKGWHLEGYFA